MKQTDSNILISIVIPIFNREFLLPGTLESLVRQTYRPLEIILVDNHSTDKSLDCCLHFQSTYSGSDFQVQVIREPHPGANAARNTGYKASMGKYLFFFDSDDRLYSDSLSRIATCLTEQSYPEAIAYPFVLSYQDGRKLRRPNRISSDAASQLFDIVLSTHNCCINRSLIEKAGLWNESLQRWQDLEFGFRLLLNTQELVWMKGKPLYEVTMHETAISSATYTQDQAILSATLDAIQETINTLPADENKHHMQRALCFKWCSVAAKIRQEQNNRAGIDLYAHAIHQIPVSRRLLTRAVLWAHYTYSSLGGRGFWRLAEKLI